jgi:class I fructose-bisphosphate aldolase
MLSVQSGVAAHAAPLGALRAGASEYAGQVPLILKLNNSDSLSKGEPCPAVTGSVQDALELGCAAIGFTIYPGSEARNIMYEQIRELVAEARSVGLPSVIWSYPRGSGLSKDGETAVDVISYGAHIACQLGAHIVKVKAPTAHIEQGEAKKIYDAQKIPISTLTERVRHVVQSTFGGRRIVIFSGGATKAESEVMSEIKEMAAGGSFGSIMGRNVFQRPKAEALRLLDQVMQAFATV